jgi:SPP1 gp7 family putative phage head morphogenesis protein
VIPSLEEIIAGFEPQVRAALEAFFQDVIKNANSEKIEAYLRSGDLRGLEAYIGEIYAASAQGVITALSNVVAIAGAATEADVNKAIESITRANAARAATGGAQYAVPTLQLPALDPNSPTGVVFYGAGQGPDGAGGFKFNPVNPYTVQATRTWQGNLIQEMAENARVAVMGSVREGVLAGQNPRTTARLIKNEALVLTSNQMGHVASFETEIDRIIANGIRSAQSWGIYTPAQIEALRLSDPAAFRDLNFTATERKVGRKWGKISRAGGTLADGQKPIGFTKPPSTQSGENAYRINADGTPKDRMTSWRLRDKTLDPLVYDIVRAEEKVAEAEAALKAAKGPWDTNIEQVRLNKARANAELARIALEEKAQVVKTRYFERYLKHRSQVIARTETLRAAQLGQLSSWRQAIKDSQVIPEEAMTRRWVTAGDDRVRLTHRAVNGQTVAFSDPFLVDGMRVMVPPAGPNCRCSVGYHLDIDKV